MLTKLHRVWTLFITNPLFWLVGSVAILVQIGFALVVLTSVDGSVLTPSNILTDYGPSFFCGLKSRQSAPSEKQKFGYEPIPRNTIFLNLSNSIDTFSDQNVWDDLKQLPHLRALETDWAFDRDFLSLTELSHLESLRLKPYPQPNLSGKTAEISPSLPSLKNLTQLRELEVTSIPISDVVEAVRENPNLHTLVYHGDLLMDATSEDLEGIGELKQLQVISIGPHLRWSDENSLRETFLELKKIPDLKLLFMDDPSTLSQSRRLLARDILPGVVVLPVLDINRSRLPLFLFGGYLHLLTITLWVSLSQSQTDIAFRYLGSAILPRHAPPHLLLGGLILGFAILMNSILLVAGGIPLLTAFSLLLTPVGVFSYGSCRAVNANPTPSSQRKQAVIGLLVFISIFLMISGTFTGRGIILHSPHILNETLWIEWIRYLYGYHPLIAIATLLFTAYSVSSLVKRAPTTYRRLLEAGVVDPAPMATQQMNTTFEWLGPVREGELPWFWRSLGKAIERSIRTSAPYDPKVPLSLYPQVSLIPRRFWLLIVTVPTIGMLLLSPAIPSNPHETLPVINLVLGILMVSVFYSPVFLVFHWYSKGDLLAQEVLIRPVTRKVIRREILQSMLRDTALWVASVLLIIGTLLVRIALEGKLEPYDPIACIGIVPLWVSFVLIYVSYLQYTVTIRHGRYGVFLVVGGGILVLAALIGAIVWQAIWMDGKVDHSLSFLVTGLLLIFSLWLVTRAYRRLLTAEFA